MSTAVKEMSGRTLIVIVYFVSSLRVKALLVRTVVSVFLNMNGTRIIVTVDQDSAELSAKGEVLNLFLFLLYKA